MRPNRKADLQRRLTLAAVPTPPTGLAERIKTDIPKHFPDSTAERRRLGSAVAFNMRVAASILLLVGSLFTALYILNRGYENDRQHLQDFSRSLENNKAPSAAGSPVPKLPQSASNVVTSTEEPPATVAPPATRMRRAENEIADAKLKKGERQLGYDDAARDREKDEAANGPSRKELADLDKQRADYGRTASAAPPVMAPPPPVSQPAEETAKVATVPKPALSEGITVTTEQAGQPAAAAASRAPYDGMSTKSAPAGSVQLQAPALAGRAQFEKASGNSVTSLVKRFSEPTERPRHGLRLETDATPSPLDPSKAVLRVSIDAAARSGASAVPVAESARFEISINGRAVESHHTMTGEPSTAEGTLDEGLSTTAIYELRLAPGVSAQTVVATVRLHFRSMPDGREQTLERTVRVSDIASSWAAAPLRTRRAFLAAAYGEARARGLDTTTIVEKARAIGFDELVDLAKPH
jgi:hypothetical protein